MLPVAVKLNSYIKVIFFCISIASLNAPSNAQIVYQRKIWNLMLTADLSCMVGRTIIYNRCLTLCD